MSKREPFHVPAEPAARPAIWRTLSEKADPSTRARAAVVEEGVQLESPESGLVAASSLASNVGRRKFMAVGTATAAAVGLSGCLRRPAEQILPYSRAPEYALPGIALHFATSMSHQGDALGLLVESHEGRPTKIEGNPDHPSSRGSTDARIQARILDLYDADRPSQPTHGGNAATWPEFDSFWREKATAFEATGGRGLAILAPPSDSPSFLRARSAMVARFPNATVHTWAPLAMSNGREGARLAFGEPLGARFELTRAKAIVALDADFLGGEPGFVRAARGFADGRRLNGPDREMSRLYVIEGGLSLTGMNADHRLRLAPSQIDRYLRALAAKLAEMEAVQLPPAVVAAVRGATAVDGVPAQWIDAVAADLAANRRRGVIQVGWRQPPHVHALAFALNQALGNLGSTIFLFDSVDGDQPVPAASLRALVDSIGDVDTLVILGGNPVYDAPADLGFAAALAQVETSIHLSPYDDETSAACTWSLPQAHELESWGDHHAIDGTLSIQQPLIAPLCRGRSDAELLAMIGGIGGWRGYHLVRSTLRATLGDVGFERAWRRALHRGITGPAPRPREAAIDQAAVGSAVQDAEPPANEGWEAVFIPSYQTYDGSQANNPWLLELPDPVTKIVWDNAAYVSAASAGELGVSSGDLLTVSSGEGQVTIPAFILPGQADRVVTLPLGFGRTRAGRHGNDVGVDVYPLRTSASLGFATGVSVSKASGTHPLVQTQDHHSMVGRPLVIDATLAEYEETPNFAQWREPTPSISPLWTQEDYSAPHPPAQGGESYSPWPDPRAARPDAPARYKWGFVIDLTTCTGCSACVIACQAENNIVVVGKEQVARGREMHWMRLDRYFVGDDMENPPVAIQPVGCQHCEEAPCENVCPVAATTHSPEGLNDMAYNRCIGTRYCMNNCPYKVRRFNFLDYHGVIPLERRMQFNPNVTVRMRGVMEKCSYCVQRIQVARIQSRTETTVDAEGEIHERRITAEEVTPACAQACPSGAITFGDLNDTESPVHTLAHMDRQYKLLASVGTQPRTTFLGKIRNPNPEMV